MRTSKKVDIMKFSPEITIGLSENLIKKWTSMRKQHQKSENWWNYEEISQH